MNTTPNKLSTAQTDLTEYFNMYVSPEKSYQCNNSGQSKKTQENSSNQSQLRVFLKFVVGASLSVKNLGFRVVKLFRGKCITRPKETNLTCPFVTISYVFFALCALMHNQSHRWKKLLGKKKKREREKQKRNSQVLKLQRQRIASN